MKPPADRVREHEQRLPELLARLGEAEPEARTAAERAARDARFMAGIDGALTAPVRPTPVRRWAAPLSAAALAASLLFAWSKLHSSARGQELRIESEYFAPRGASTEHREPAAPALPAEPEPAREQTPRRKPAASNERTADRANAPPLGELENAVPTESPELGARAVASSSTLAAEIQLFEASAQAERTGDVEGALVSLDRLVALNPASPLAQQAMVRKFRTLQRARREAEAQQAAQAYLQAFPDGFAQGEAKDLVLAGGLAGQPQSPTR